jgi:aerobic carbon-monoxide dehydrogenase large subunit
MMGESGLRFGSGHGAIRSEDAPLVTGAGKFTDDINLPGQAYVGCARDDPEGGRCGGR